MDILQMNEPKQFISYQNGKMVIDVEILAILNQVTCSVSSISIAGKFRSGKSYLMNRFYGKNHGFALGSKIHAETKGIWIWIKEHPHIPDTALVLLDTEGIYDPEVGDRSLDIKIFTLAVVLSNDFIYNIMKNLGSNELTELKFIADLLQFIKLNKNASFEETHDQLSMFMPKLHFVIRDFTLEDEIPSDQYLDDVFKSKKKDHKDMRELKDTINGYFPPSRRDLNTLQPPAFDFRKMKDLENLHEDELNPDFKDEADRMINKMLSSENIFQMSASTQRVSVAAWALYAEMCVQSINDGETIDLLTSIEKISQKMDDMAFKEIDAAYKKIITAAEFPMEPEKLNDLFKKVEKKAHTIAHSFSASTEKYQEKISSLRNQLLSKNKEKSTKLCESLARECFNDVTGRHQSGFYIKDDNMNQYASDFSKALKKYLEYENKGPQAEHVLLDYLNKEEEQHKALLANYKEFIQEKKRLAKEIERKEKERKENEENIKEEIKKQCDADAKKGLEKELKSLQERALKDKEDFDKIAETAENPETAKKFTNIAVKRELITTAKVASGTLCGAIGGAVKGAEYGLEITEGNPRMALTILTLTAGVGAAIGGVSGAVISLNSEFFTN